MSDSGLIFDDDEDIVFFFPGNADVWVTPADGSEPYAKTVHVDSWKGSIDGKPIVTIPLEEA